MTEDLLEPSTQQKATDKGIGEHLFSNAPHVAHFASLYSTTYRNSLAAPANAPPCVGALLWWGLPEQPRAGYDKQFT